MPLNAEEYCQQLERLEVTFNEKGPKLINPNKVIFHQDNVRSWICNVYPSPPTRQTSLLQTSVSSEENKFINEPDLRKKMIRFII